MKKIKRKEKEKRKIILNGFLKIKK